MVHGESNPKSLSLPILIPMVIIKSALQLPRSLEISPPIIHNIKFHFRTKHPIHVSRHRHRRLSFHRNFVAWRPFHREDSLAFHFFPSSGHVNVTGIRNGELISTAIQLFCETFSNRLKPNTVHIDNCTASGQLTNLNALNSALKTFLITTEDGEEEEDVESLSSVPERLDLALIKQYIESRQDRFSLKVNLRAGRFPGACIRLGTNRPTITIFSTGTYIIVGAKSEREVNRLYYAIKGYVLL